MAIWPLALGLLLLITGCTHASEVAGPRSVLERYAAALEAGRIEEAYSLLSDEAKRELPFEQFRKMIEENRAEIREIADSLRGPAEAPAVTATVTAANGETLLLMYEDGAWRVDGASVDLYGQRSPKQTIGSFVRAFENGRFDVLMRFVPNDKLEGLNAEKLQTAWEGEQRQEMQQLVSTLKASLDDAQIEIIANRATLSYGAGGSVELVEEDGVWKIEEF